MTLQRPIKPPSYRQEQVAKLIAWGLEYKAIGVKLGISDRTVRHHVDELARLIPAGEDEGELSEVFTPYMRVQTWAFWEYRIKPKLKQMAA